MRKISRHGKEQGVEPWLKRVRERVAIPDANANMQRVWAKLDMARADLQQKLPQRTPYVWRKLDLIDTIQL